MLGLGLGYVVDDYDVGVFEARDRACLALEPLEEPLVLFLAPALAHGHYLDGDVPVQHVVVR